MNAKKAGQDCQSASSRARPKGVLRIPRLQVVEDGLRFDLRDAQFPRAQELVEVRQLAAIGRERRLGVLIHHARRR